MKASKFSHAQKAFILKRGADGDFVAPLPPRSHRSLRPVNVSSGRGPDPSFLITI